MSMLQETVRIYDRFIDRANPDSIDRTGRLLSCLVLVTVFHLILSIAFTRMQELEKTHRRPIPELTFAIELTTPPPEPVLPEMPPPTSLIMGQDPDTGGASSAPTHKATVTIPHPANQTDRQQVVHMPPSLQFPQPPINVISLNPIVVAPPAAVAPPAGTTAPANSAKAPPGGQPGDGVGSDPLAPPDSNQSGIAGRGKDGIFGDGVGDKLVGGPKLQPKIALNIAGTATGNIAPYRKDFLQRLARNWHPNKKMNTVILLITVLQNGEVSNIEVFASGGAKANKQAINAAQDTEFAPLPDWYRGTDLTFQITMDAEGLSMLR